MANSASESRSCEEVDRSFVHADNQEPTHNRGLAYNQEPAVYHEPTVYHVPTVYQTVDGEPADIQEPTHNREPTEDQEPADNRGSSDNQGPTHNRERAEDQEPADDQELADDQQLCQSRLSTAGSPGDDNASSETAQGDTPIDAIITPESEAGNTLNPSIQDPATWCPKWLSFSILMVFFSLFLVLTAILPVMLHMSQANNGLVEIPMYMHAYLWRLAPTAVLTLISIFWSRVETQTLRYMPWMDHNQTKSNATEKNPEGHPKDYSLDYTSMLLPKVIVQSLRRRHYLVFLVVIISIVLKIQVVLASGLYSLGKTEVSEMVDIELLDSFNALKNISSPLTPKDKSVYYVALAVKSFEMRHPFGVQPTEAYATFRSAGGSRGSPETPLKAVVDAYSSETECFKLSNFSYSEIAAFSGEFSLNSVQDLQLYFEGCEEPFLIHKEPKASFVSLSNVDVNWEESGLLSHWVSIPALTRPIKCGDGPQQGDQSIYYAARFEKSTNNSSIPVLAKLGGVICSSKSWLFQTEVLDDGVRPSIIPLSETDKLLVAFNTWELISRGLPISWDDSWTNFMLGPFRDFKKFYGLSTDEDDASIYTSEKLYESTMNMTNILAPWAGHYILREKPQQTRLATGWRTRKANRLIVNYWNSMIMTVSFGLLTIVSALVAHYMRRRSAIWYRDPATILGNILFFQASGALPKQAIESISGTQKNGETVVWSQCAFIPLVLWKWAQAAFLIMILSMITGLCYSLRVSESSNGLTTITNPRDPSYLLWTSVPTTLLLIVVLYVNSCDAVYRGLATLSTLYSDGCNAQELDISLSDMLGFQVLYYSVQRKIPVVTISQILTMLCGVLTTLSSILFTTEQTQILPLQQETWFGSKKNQSITETEREALGNLLMRRGQDSLYPRNTYDDLVFPSFTESSLRNISVSVNIPAAKLNATCRKLPASSYHITDLEPAENEANGHFTIHPQKAEAFRCPNGTLAQLIQPVAYTAYAPIDDGHLYFAEKEKSPENLDDIKEICNLQLNDSDVADLPSRILTYAWGKYSLKNKAFDHLSFWRCNYTWVEVPTDVVFKVTKNGEYMLDTETHPRPNVSNSRPWHHSFPVPQLDDSQQGGYFPMVSIDERVAGWLDPCFRTILQPYGKLSLDAFGDTSQEDDILEILHYQWGFLAAQLANKDNRLHLKEHSRSRPPPAAVLLNLNATIIGIGPKRLLQSLKVTYITVGILAITAIGISVMLACSALSSTFSRLRFLGMNVRGLAPDGFNSIASMAALLSTSNASQHMPRDAEHMASKNLYEQLSGLRFRMGWFNAAASNAQYFTVGVLDDEDFEFVGSKEQVEKQEPGSAASSS